MATTVSADLVRRAADLLFGFPEVEGDVIFDEETEEIIFQNTEGEEVDRLAY